MNCFNDFQQMINNLNEENLSELCEQFLTDHEGAMIILSRYCRDFGLVIDNIEIKDHMSTMHSNGDFDNVMEVLSSSIKWNVNYKNKAVFVTKFLPNYEAI